MNRIKALCLAAAAGTFALAGQAAVADSIEFESVMKTSLGGGLTEWDYTVKLSSNSNILTGDRFVILDFGGYVPLSIDAPTDWLALTGAFELPPGTISSGTSTTTETEDATTNLRFVYTGLTPISGEVTIAGFKATTTLTGEGISHLLGADHSKIGNMAQTNSSVAIVPVPLPAAAWAGMALMGAIGTNSIRKRRKEALC